MSQQITPPSKEAVAEFLERGVSEVIDKKKLEEQLLSGKRLRIYQGIDPTGFELHIGHAIGLHKLRQLQDWGHHVILLIGDFTAMIGDPTGRDKAREPLTTEQVLENAKDYQQQASAILNFDGENPVEVVYNSHWLSKLNFAEVVELSANFTVQQMLERDMYQRRIKEGKPVSLHEFFYPLMQAYDSVHLDVDLEIGGNDQLFNILTGRTLKDKLRGEEKHAMTLQILEGSDGRKMSKSFNNHIPIAAEATDMFGRVMAVQDDLIVQYFELTTKVSQEELNGIKAELASGANPRDLKMRLGRELVSMYHSEAVAQEAQQAFIDQFQKGAIPEDIQDLAVGANDDLVDVLIQAEMASSKTDARALIKQGAVKINDEKVAPEDAPTFTDGDILQKGKRAFRRLRVS